MAKELILEVSEHIKLYRDPRTGLAWVENGTVGLAHSAHPNIDASGSVRGMKLKGFWKRNARTIKSHGFIYNIDRCSVNLDDALDMLAMRHCRCGGVHLDEASQVVESAAS